MAAVRAGSRRCPANTAIWRRTHRGNKFLSEKKRVDVSRERGGASRGAELRRVHTAREMCVYIVKARGRMYVWLDC